MRYCSYRIFIVFTIAESLQRSVSVDPLQLTTGRTTARKPLTSNQSVDILDASQSPTTSAPFLTVSVTTTPPPPPPPPSSLALLPPAAATNDRTQLLNSITEFSQSALKKTKTNDRSAPKTK